MSSNFAAVDIRSKHRTLYRRNVSRSLVVMVQAQIEIRQAMIKESLCHLLWAHIYYIKNRVVIIRRLLINTIASISCERGGTSDDIDMDMSCQCEWRCLCTFLGISGSHNE
jgi:hypothetical protein